MPTEVTRPEFDELAEEVAGEKIVTRHILEQTRRNGDDLAAVKTRVARVEEKVDGLDRKVDGLDHKLSGLARDISGIVRDTMREVLRESARKTQRRPVPLWPGLCGHPSVPRTQRSALAVRRSSPLFPDRVPRSGIT
jgi:hypothetical protein